MVSVVGDAGRGVGEEAYESLPARAVDADQLGCCLHAFLDGYDAPVPGGGFVVDGYRVSVFGIVPSGLAQEAVGGGELSSGKIVLEP